MLRTGGYLLHSGFGKGTRGLINAPFREVYTTPPSWSASPQDMGCLGEITLLPWAPRTTPKPRRKFLRASGWRQLREFPHCSGLRPTSYWAFVACGARRRDRCAGRFTPSIGPLSTRRPTCLDSWVSYALLARFSIRHSLSRLPHCPPKRASRLVEGMIFPAASTMRKNSRACSDPRVNSGIFRGVNIPR
jgi:hypothetical protein